MTSKEKVSSVHPDAWEGASGHIYRSDHNVNKLLDEIGKNWDDAASKLPCAPSPSRDFSCGASYCDDPACNTHGAKDADGELLYWKQQSAPSLVEVTASGCRCGGTGEVCYSSTSYGPCPECVKRNALPEPVSPEVIHVPRIPGTVNTPKGPMIPKSAPVSPDGAAESMCQSRSSAGYQCIQSVAGHRKYHSTVAAPIEESNGGVFWCDDPAAPIAPAAEELIQERLKFERWYAANRMQLYMHLDTRLRCAIEDTARESWMESKRLTRAEEYRKGAKN